MRAVSCLALVFVAGLGGCALDRPADSPDPGAPSPGQWTPQQAAYPQGPAPQPQPQPQLQPPAWPAQPQSQAPGWPAPQPPPPQAQPSFPWPSGWTPPLLPPPIAWPATPSLPSWPGFPALPGWPSQPQPAPGQPPALPPQPGQPAPPLAAGGDVAQRCVDDINRYRATKGLSALARWAEAEPCAAGEAAQDARSQTPHGSFGGCREAAQNACPNWPGPAERMTDECLRMMWNEGPGEFPAHGHYENMVSTRSTMVACAVHTMTDGKLWAVQDFR